MQETPVQFPSLEDPREGTGYPLQYSWAFLVAQLVKHLPAMRETYVRSLGWEDLLEKGLHDMISSYFHGRSFRIPQTKWCGFHRHFCLPHYSTGCTFWLLSVYTSEFPVAQEFLAKRNCVAFIRMAFIIQELCFAGHLQIHNK